MENKLNQSITGLSMDSLGLVVPTMWQGDIVTVPCAAAFVLPQFDRTSPVTYGDITIVVEFRPILIPKFLHLQPWRRHYRFVTAKQSDGNLRWVPEPDNYPPKVKSNSN